MSQDITKLLAEWPYLSTDDLMVRKIAGPNGELRLQVRLELGLLEMRTDGRPDGVQPNGFDSILDYHLDRIRRELDADPEHTFQLSHDECTELQRESMQYYHRRIGYLKLGEFALAASDAEHNLAIMDLLRERAADKADWLASEQYRSFVLNHLARARLLEALDEADIPAALEAVDDGIHAIEHLFRDEYQRPDLLDKSDDLQALRQIRQALIENDRLVATERRETEEQRLERELVSAIGREDFERAARLRDALSSLRRQRGQAPSA